MAPISVLHVITGLAMGGAEQMLLKQLRLIDRSGFTSTVVSLTDRGLLGDSIAELGVPLYTLGMSRGVADPRALLRLGLLLRKVAPDVLQTWMPHSDLMGTLARKFARGARLAWNIRCSEVDFTHYRPATRLAVSCLARLSKSPELVICNSEAGKVAHQALGYSPRRWEVIPNGFDLTHFRPLPEARLRLRAALGIAPDAFVIGLVARFDVMKDHATALNALRQFPDAHLVCVGRDVVATNPAFAAPDLAGRLHLLGERRDINEILPGCDVATLTSAFGEGFPNVLGEAMACALPCVATDVGDTRAILGDTGLLVAPRDPAALSAAWRKLADAGPAHRADLGIAARARIVAHWSLPAIVRRYEDVYSSLMTRKSD